MVIGPRGNEVAPLEGDREVVIKINYGDFERFIKEMFGHDYCFAADQECGNDSKHEFDTNPRWFDDTDREDVERFIRTGHGMYLAGKLIQYCAMQGWLESGTYLISVSW